MLKRVFLCATITAGLLAAQAVEQTSPGKRAAAEIVASFDGMSGRNPSDNSLAVGPDRVVEIVNSRMQVYDKRGKVLRAARQPTPSSKDSADAAKQAITGTPWSVTISSRNAG